MRSARCAAIARRSGGSWFVGAITNNDGRTLTLPLHFLKPGMRYLAHVYSDGGDAIPTRTHVKIDRFIVDATTIMTANLKPSGGLALEIVPATGDDLRRYPPYAGTGK